MRACVRHGARVVCVVCVACVALAAACAFSPAFGDGQLACGSGGACPDGYVCGADGRCHLVDGARPCGSCVALGADCGKAVDDCGHVLDCGGGCDNGNRCGGGGAPNVCGPAECRKHDCAALGVVCGTFSDGCDNVIHCTAGC
jgi:hypothetical protein